MQRSLSWIAEAVDGQLVNEAGDQSASGTRAQDLSLVVTDSREAVDGSTYVARRGENSDGHEFAESAVKLGANALIVEYPLPEISVPQIVVKESTDALGKLAAAHLAALREEGSISVVGITGSAGKTTTKDLLGRILSSFGATVWPKLSFNNEVGCPITILKADEATKFLVLEMGASAPGELRYLTNIAPLDVGVVLMVGRAHLGGFGSQDALAEAKGELVQGIRSSGTAVLNLDDSSVEAMRSKAPGKILWFSATGQEAASVWAKDVSFDQEGRPAFEVCTAQESKHVRLGLVGAHQVSNAIAAVAVTQAMGLDFGTVIEDLDELTAGSPHRMDVRNLVLRSEKGEAKVRLVDDSYNANPDSMKAAFTTTRRLAHDGRVVMVLGEMLELGPDSSVIHGEVGSEALRSKPAVLIPIGNASTYFEGQMPAELAEVSVLRATDDAEALSLLARVIQPGDTILVKGSNGSGSWKVADGLIAMSESAGGVETA